MKKYYYPNGSSFLSQCLTTCGLLFTLLLLLPTLVSAQTITGTVFRDFNENGTYTTIPASGTYAYGEPGVPGVVVTAYSTNSATAPVSTTTSSTGTYTLTVGSTSAFRVEFTNLPAGNYDGFYGTSSKTSIQFVTGGSIGVNFGINLPENYCQTNPRLVIPCYENGSGVLNTNPVVVSLDYTDAGITTQNVYPTGATADAVGSTWGVAYDKKTKLTYLSAFLKRQAGLGDRGLDGIYVINSAGATQSLLGGFDLEGVMPSNGGAAISFGSVTRTLIASGNGTGVNDLSADRTKASRDEDAYGKVAKVGYGDIDIDQASNTLWAVNLNERSLVAIDISSTLHAAAVPTTLAGAKVKRYFIDGTTTPSITGIPSCPSGVMRPFGLKIQNGVGYLGIVCDGSALTTPDITASQQAYVLSFNTANPTVFTQVANVPLNYAREQGWVPFAPTATFDALESDKWQRWIDTYTDPTTFGSAVNSANADFKTGINGFFVGAPQAVLADIEFLPNGNLVLGFMDRFAHQQGWQNYVKGSSTVTRSGVSQGDILLGYFNGSGYTFEGPNENDNFTTPPVAANAQPGQLLTDGPSGAGEFFYQDYYIGFDATHPETSLGGLAILPGSNEVTDVTFDPADYNSMGVRWFNSTTGYQSRNYTIAANTNIANFGKGSGLGDVELLCDLAPIQIGNRVWNDLNNNGIQDPGEPSLAGITVILKGPGLPPAGTTVVTGSNGEYYFSNATGTNTTGFVYSLTGLTSGGSYSLTFPTSASAGAYLLSTKTNSATGTNADAIDTDPNMAGVVSFTLGQAGQNNFTYDAGYFQPASLGDYVFEDKNANGIQDTGDVPISGVTVTLYASGTVVGTTLTNGSGLYSFTGLTPGTSYTVGFGTPVGFTPTLSNVGSDTADSDAGVGGLTGAYSLTAGENNPTIDAGFYKPASLGDYVFFDADKSGTQNSGDVPIPGVVVTLYLNGSAIATTTTNGSGLYSFTGLTPGTSNSYVVGFTTPSGYTATTTNTGSNSAVDSDLIAATGRTISYTLSSGQNNTSIDAGFICQLPSVTALASSASVCVGTPVTLTAQLSAAGSYTYVWSGPAGVTLTGGATATATASNLPTGTNTFTVTVSSNPFCSTAATVSVVVNPIPIASLSASSATICAGSSTTLTASGGTSYTLTPGNVVSGTGIFTLTPASTTTYTVVVANASGCISTTTATLTVNPIPVVTVTNVVCNGLTTYAVDFTATAGALVTANVGTLSGNSVTGIPSGQQVILTATLNSCSATATANRNCESNAASLGDYVFVDANANGQQDGGDSALPGVTVTLYLNGAALATTTTDASGFYSFTGLTPGSSNSYSVGFTAPTGYTATLANVGADATDSDGNPATGITSSYTLAAGENNLTIDMGYYKPASLGDYVFNDTNKDGIQNTGDTPIPGVLVTLYLNGSAVATTTTDVSGLYSFTGLTPGTANNYAVGFATPTNFTATSPLAGTNPALDSDPVGGITAPVTLTSGENNITLDAGFYQLTAGLGDYVFEDKNANGIQDTGDVPISGVTVTLYASGTTVGTTSTDANGFYSFTGLTPGTSYTVGFGTPAGFTPTLSNVGSDTADSDAGVGGLTGAYSLTANEFNPTVDAGFIRAVTPAPAYTIAKTVDLKQVEKGQLVTYTLSVTNTSPTTATALVFTDQLSNNTATLVGSATASAGSFAPTANGGVWSLSSLAGGQVATLSYQVQLNEEGITYNTLTAPNGQTATVCVSVPAHVCANEDFQFILTAPASYSTYQWSRNGQPIAGATSSTYSVTAIGEYSVAATSNSGCPDGSCCPFIVVADPAPSLTALAVSAQCVDQTPQANAAITLVGSSTGAVSYNITKGSSFTAAAPLFASPQALAAVVGGVLVSGQPNPALAQDYTIRVYAADGCFADTVVSILPTTCACPPDKCAPFVIRKTKTAGKPVAP